MRLRDAMRETATFGFARARAAQQELGDRVRALLAGRGIAASPRRASRRPASSSATPTTRRCSPAGSFLGQGLQIAAGVPLQCDEGPDFRSFRIGLFGLDKLGNIDRTVAHLDRALTQIL